MIITRLIVKNWRNFRRVDVPLTERQFIVGPNASGKSNLLDIFRFLRDSIKMDAGFQDALNTRGGISSIRCLSAEEDPEVGIEIHLSANSEAPTTWQYSLGFHQEAGAAPQARLTYERVWKNRDLLLDRPDAADKAHPEQLVRSGLERSIRDFRELVDFLGSITDAHLVACNSLSSPTVQNNPFVPGFLERIASVDEKTRCSRLKIIERALKAAIPQFEKLAFIRDNRTRHPHLQARYSHWHPKASWQREDQFSNGTLRLIVLLWLLLESDSVLLLEEPELSLNPELVAQFAPLFFQMQASKNQQVLISTQSDVLLAEPGIDGTEVLMLTPTKAGTEVKLASDIDDVRVLLKTGFTAGEVVFSGYSERLGLLG